MFACPLASAHCETGSVNLVREQERTHRLQDTATYTAFGVRVVDTKWKLLAMLMELKGQGSRIAGYGAPGKGNTLLNYCGIRTDFLDFTVDRNPYKHGRSLPGLRIPVLPVERLLRGAPGLRDDTPLESQGGDHDPACRGSTLGRAVPYSSS